VWRCVDVRIVRVEYSFDSYEKINFSQSQIQSMIWESTLQIRKHDILVI